MLKYYLRKLNIPLVAMFLITSLLLLAVPVLALTYDAGTMIGLGVEPVYWGASIVELSETVSEISILNMGYEDGWDIWLDWYAYNNLTNTWICGTSGSGYYFPFPQPAGSLLVTMGFFSWDGGGTSNGDNIAHPYAQ